jgi:hypothetical protein
MDAFDAKTIIDLISQAGGVGALVFFIMAASEDGSYSVENMT